MYTNSKAQQTNKIQNNKITLQIPKKPKPQNSKGPILQDSVDVKSFGFFGFLDFRIFKLFEFWNFGFLDFWILGSFVFPVLLFDTNSASESEPKSDQQKSRFRTGFYSVLKGYACRKGGDHTCTYVCIYLSIHLSIYPQMNHAFGYFGG